MISLNCQSIRNKIYSVLSYLDEKQTEIACLQETWLSTGDSSIYQIIKEHGYKILKVERKESIRGGGLAILYKTGLRIQIVKDSIKKTYNSFEYLCTRFYFIVRKKHLPLSTCIDLHTLQNIHTRLKCLCKNLKNF